MYRDTDTEARALRMPVRQGVGSEEPPDTTHTPTLSLLPKYGPVEIAWRDGKVVARAPYRLERRPLTEGEAVAVFSRLLQDQDKIEVCPRCYGEYPVWYPHSCCA